MFPRLIQFGFIKTFFIVGLQQGQLLVAGCVAFVLLGSGEYGRITVLGSSLNALIAIGTMSSGVAAYGYAARSKHADYGLLSQVLSELQKMLLFSAAIAVVIFAVGAFFLNEKVPVKDVLELICVALFLFASVYFSYQQGVLLGLDVLDRYLRINVFFFFAAPFVVTTAIYAFKASGYYFSLALLILLRAALLLRVVSQKIAGPLLPRLSQLERKRLWAFVLPATIAGVTTLPAQWYAYTQLFVYPQGAADLGLVGIAILVKQIPLLLCTSLVSRNGRNVFALHGLPAQAQRAFRKLLLQAIGLGLLLLCCFEILQLLYKFFSPFESYRLDNKTVDILFFVKVVFAIEVVNAVLYLPMTSHRLMWRSFFFIALPRDILCIVLAYLLIPKHGWSGFAMALTAPLLFSTILTIVVGLLSVQTRVYFSRQMRS